MSMSSGKSQGMLAESYALAYVLARALEAWYVRDILKRAYKTMTRGLKGISAAMSEATESMEALSAAIGPIYEEMDEAFDRIVESDNNG